jgi:hypothetical protein
LRFQDDVVFVEKVYLCTIIFQSSCKRVAQPRSLGAKAHGGISSSHVQTFEHKYFQFSGTLKGVYSILKRRRKEAFIVLFSCGNKPVYRA